MMTTFLEDVQDAEANVTRVTNQFLRERGWKEDSSRFKRSDRYWSKVDWDAKMLTTEEAIDAEKIMGNETLFKECAV